MGHSSCDPDVMSPDIYDEGTVRSLHLTLSFLCLVSIFVLIVQLLKIQFFFHLYAEYGNSFALNNCLGTSIPFHFISGHLRSPTVFRNRKLSDRAICLHACMTLGDCNYSTS